jgi:hypothetical protein
MCINPTFVRQRLGKLYACFRCLATARQNDLLELYFSAVSVVSMEYRPLACPSLSSSFAKSTYFIKGYYKWFISFYNSIFSKVLHIQTWLIYKKNRKLTKIVLCAPAGSTSSVPLQNGDKERKEFLCVGICEMFVCSDSGDFVFQQDDAPPHWNINVRRYNELPHRWIGRVCEDDVGLFPWPPRSPDLTPCDFFLWGYIKDLVYVPPLPRTL